MKKPTAWKISQDKLLKISNFLSWVEKSTFWEKFWFIKKFGKFMAFKKIEKEKRIVEGFEPTTCGLPDHGATTHIYHKGEAVFRNTCANGSLVNSL